MTSVFAPSVEVIEWQHAPCVGQVVTVAGWCDGLPVFTWAGSSTSAPKAFELHTERQLAALELRPVGDPVAVLRFRHRRPARSVELASLWPRHCAVPKRVAAPGQMAGCHRAHRTCRRCGEVANRYLPKCSRMCLTCEDATKFYETYEVEHYGMEVAA